MATTLEEAVEKSERCKVFIHKERGNIGADDEKQINFIFGE